MWICNVLKCRPPGNRDPQPIEIESCEPYLFSQVELIEPRVVATLGNFATKLLTGSRVGITRVRGTPQVREIGDRTVFLLPLLHPAAALRTPSLVDTLREDFAKLPELIERPASRGRSGAHRRGARTELGRAARGSARPVRLTVERERPPRRRREAIGARLAAALRPGDVVLVSGRARHRQDDARSAAPAASSASIEPVTSPTFTIGHRYRGRVPVSHLDLLPPR